MVLWYKGESVYNGSNGQILPDFSEARSYLDIIGSIEGL